MTETETESKDIIGMFVNEIKELEFSPDTISVLLELFPYESGTLVIEAPRRKHKTFSLVMFCLQKIFFQPKDFTHIIFFCNSRRGYGSIIRLIESICEDRVKCEIFRRERIQCGNVLITFVTYYNNESITLFNEWEPIYICDDIDVASSTFTKLVSNLKTLSLERYDHTNLKLIATRISKERKKQISFYRSILKTEHPYLMKDLIEIEIERDIELVKDISLFFKESTFSE